MFKNLAHEIHTYSHLGVHKCIFIVFSCTTIFADSLILSETASSRATAYELSNKFLFDENYIYVTYLDFIDGQHQVILAKIDRKDFKLVKKVNIGDGRDNHGGASMLIDSEGNFHIFYGAHNTKLKYRYNTDGAELKEFSEEIEFTSNCITYPSAVISADDEITVVARFGCNVMQNDPWSYVLYRLKNGESLSEQEILVSRRHDEDFVDRYIHYFAQLVIDRYEQIHLAWILHERSSNDPTVPSNGLGYGIGYLSTGSDGAWFDAYGTSVKLPGHVNDYALLEGEKNASIIVEDYRSVSMAIDPTTNNPVIAFVKYHLAEKKWTTWIAERVNGRWEKSFVTETLYKMALYISNDGERYILGEKLIDPSFSVEEGWSNSGTSIVLLKSHDFDNGFVQELLSPEMEGPHWYPSLPKQSSFSNGYMTFPVGLYMTGNKDGSAKVTLRNFQ